MNVRIIAMAVVAALTRSERRCRRRTSRRSSSSAARLAEQIQDFNTINLATAERIAETCEKLAAAENVAITMYMLDSDGNHVYMDRMDGRDT